MLISVLLLLGSLAVLIKASDYLVEEVSKIAEYFGISEFIIGLTVVAIGTSLPELASAVMASFSGASELAVGNIVGADMSNLALNLGIVTILMTIKSTKRMFYRDCLMLLLSVIVFYIFAMGGVIGRIEGLVLFIVAIVYLLYALEFRKRIRGIGASKLLHFRYHVKKPEQKVAKEKGTADFVEEGFEKESDKSKAHLAKKYEAGITRSLIIVAIAAVLILISADFLVGEAVEMATKLGISEAIIGATIIAIGTSLPELMVSFSSIKRGLGDMILGNVIGSSIFNITLVGGLSAMVAPLAVTQWELNYSLPVLLLTTSLILVFIRWRWKINWPEGILLLALYSSFIISLLIGAGII